MSIPVVEGFVPFSWPAAGKPCQTYYKLYGDLKSGPTPLIFIHGGYGYTHKYGLPHTDLAAGPRAIPVLFYDQIGCGQSTHLPEKVGDWEFWLIQHFIDELENLISCLGIQTYDVLGHSWGAVLGAELAIRRPRGLRRLVLASGLASMDLWSLAARNLLKTIPDDLQKVINDCEKAGKINAPEYEAAMTVFAKQFVCRPETWPPEVSSAFEENEKDMTMTKTLGGGMSDFHVTGSMKDWSVIPDIHKINVPVLMTNGRYDGAQDYVVGKKEKAI
ncbi:proline-specific peptidase [Laetiporus sulphureus 93-53]|uniref:Proline-specific peptidase n=1 Tax=Laetiporus sulphureus 93-53 TaxID=1314785 RepID=A0A165EYW9_9APHY|nr:proline-specific peptidase [Laetiporus sulphureus 93-53]KZT08006.1 proline-specific peptidase [Laetiporus sulphureus 93-53]